MVDHKAVLIWRCFLFLFCGVILIIPIYEVYSYTSQGNGEWVSCYVLNTFEYTTTIFPILVLILLIPKIEEGKIKQTLKIILYLLSGFISLLSFNMLSLPMQDLVPTWGALLLLFLFPLVLFNSFIENKVKYFELKQKS